MASVPLRCNICPSEPTFSDTSHLLTHVSSKGHLSHYFKCQVRSRQDENVRHKIDVYDQWYNTYEIEKLLSQRMVAKQSKPRAPAKAPAVKKQASTNPSSDKKERKPRARRQSKKGAHEAPSAPGTHPTDILDPQLSGAAGRTGDHTEPNPSDVGPQAPIPHMSDYPMSTPHQARPASSQISQPQTSRRILQTPSQGDPEDDVFRTFIRSPTASAPRAINELPISAQLLQAANEASAGEDIHVASPVLKGIRYPGMSLFDAASRKAQRLRNQKKELGIMEQLELDAAAIEPMEHIYWPEGNLKKSRVITGEVESSPIKEDTPPPTRFIDPNQSQALTQFSTNVPVYIGKRVRDTSSQEELGSRLDLMAHAALGTIKAVYPKARPISPIPVYESDNDMEVLGSPLRFDKTPHFSIFRDNEAQPGLPPLPLTNRNGEKLDASLPFRSSPRHSSPWRSLSANLAPSSSNRSPINPFGRGPRIGLGERSPNHILTPSSTDDKENLPHTSSDHRDVEYNESPQRATQRYFSMLGDNAPQYYTSMPPAMDFGGLFGRSFYGPSVNPLNAFNHRQYVQPDYLEAEAEIKSPAAAAGSKKRKSVTFR